jgi:hypothetical protein
MRWLKDEYCRLVDSGYAQAGNDPRAFANLFTEDGRWDVSGRPLIGRSAIAGAAASGRFRLHLVANPRLEMEDGTGQGTWSVLALSTDAESNALWLAGTYADTFRETDAGWRFAEVTFHPAFRVPYEDGWAPQFRD